MQIVLEKMPAVSFLLGEQSINTAAVYRRASFCVVTEVGGQSIAYNVLTGGLVELNEQETALLCSEEIHVSEVSLPFIRDYYLVPFCHDDEKLCDGVTAFLRAAAKRDTYRHFTIFPTTDCNARCFYCYELGGKRKPMSSDTAVKTAEFIIAASRGERVYITWYGGEPLMNTAVIDIISTALEKNGAQYSAKLATNASLINDDLIKKAKGLWHVDKAQVTLDGTPEVYDRIKAYADGKSNFETVISNVEKLLDNDIKVNIRLNVDTHNIDNMYALCELLVSRFGGRQGLNVYSALLFDCDGAKRPSSTAEERLVLAERLVLLEDKCAAQGILHPRKLHRGAAVGFCTADAEDALVITADGNFVKCDFFTDSRFVGDVNSGIDKERLAAEREFYGSRVNCSGCSAYSVCLRPSGCPTGGCDAARRYLTEERLVRSVCYAYMKAREKSDIQNCRF